MTDHPKCSTCRFWTPPTEADITPRQSIGPGDRRGRCRRRPPVVVVLPDPNNEMTPCDVSTEWPRTEDWEWCGKWKMTDDAMVECGAARRLPDGGLLLMGGE